MNKNTLLTIAGLGILAYFLLRRKNNPAKEIGQAPDVKNAGKVVEGVDAGTKAETTATLRLKGVKVPRKRLLMTEDIKVPVKQPIMVSPTNLIPNVYDRGVGQPIDISANGDKYYNMSGFCSENVQNACRCSEKGSGNYKLDIPTLP